MSPPPAVAAGGAGCETVPREERTLNAYDEVIASYDREAPALAERYDALPEGASLTECSAFLPSAGLALDVGRR